MRSSLSLFLFYSVPLWLFLISSFFFLERLPRASLPPVPPSSFGSVYFPLSLCAKIPKFFPFPLRAQPGGLSHVGAKTYPFTHIYIYMRICALTLFCTCASFLCSHRCTSLIPLVRVLGMIWEVSCHRVGERKTGCDSPDSLLSLSLSGGHILDGMSAQKKKRKKKERTHMYTHHIATGGRSIGDVMCRTEGKEREAKIKV